MGRLLLAIRTFFAILFNRQVAERAYALLGHQDDAAEPMSTATAAKPSAAPKPTAAARQPPTRNEALTLLAALQNEARLVDFLQEPIDAYSDAQIGAAVREVHRGCAAVLERMFELRPVLAQGEGSAVQLPSNFEAQRFRLTGKVGEAPYDGRLVHHGWEASRCELPQWTGNEKSARIVAPAEVEIG